MTINDNGFNASNGLQLPFRTKQMTMTADEWAVSDVILNKGEFGIAFHTDSNKYEAKIGDGEHKWANLPVYLQDLVDVEKTR
jgi:hypothetical protein